MSALQALGLAGFRSYSPQSLQKIEFETPLTLIWGKNGSGKTTIIEVLKYITTGALPPSCDKGKNFIMDPKMMNQSELVGDARLKFRAFNGRPVLAKRRTLLSVTTKGGKFESIEQTLKTKDEKGEMFQINHQCAEIEKQIPQLLGISKAVLQNIVFCHQDESLWPFSDSNNLKAIFDEMFETRRYTKIIDSFWEQYKEYSKEIKESKKAMEYLKRLYDEDNRKKRIAIREMEKVAEQSQEVAAIKQALQQLNVKPNASKQTSDRKYQLIMKRGILEERINVGMRTVRDLRTRMNTINAEYSSIFGTQVRPGQGIAEIDRKAANLSRNRQELQQQLQQTQSATVFTQKQMQVLGQVKRAKLCLQELKNESNEDQILRKLHSKCIDIQAKRGELSKLKKQRDQMVLPTLLDLPLNQTAYQQQKRALSAESQRLQQIKQEILRMYNGLYKTVSLKRSVEWDANVEERLKEVHVRIKLKKEQLAKYEAMTSFESIQIQKVRLQYGGIDFQQQALDYCIQKKKCVICSKQLLQADLKAMKIKCERTISKTNKKIQELQEKNAREGHQQQLDPQQVIPLLRKEIASAEAVEIKLSHAYEEYATYKQQSDQAKLNERLTACLKRVALEREIAVTTGNVNSNEQTFLQRIGQYQNLKLRLEHRAKEVRLYEERVKRNRDIQQQRQSISEQTSKLRQRIGEYEQQSEGYELISSIYNRLSSLLKSRGSRKPNSKSKQSDNETSSPEELEQQLASISRQLRGLALEKEYTEASMHAGQLEEEGKQLLEEFRGIDRELRVLEEQIDSSRAREAEYGRLNVQYVSRKRQLDLKAELSFQESNHPVQKEYLLKKMQLATKQASAHDIQMLCRSMEGSISAFHRQKMDEVNKYLAEIWREVYHGDDIRLIEIQAAFEEDAKRRKGYSYSILMQKAGGKKMEMKGRCSMGQKVLASIVIRLALAEVFANSARILALDEPTTNLDREHIGNLAHQLGRLVELNEGKYLQMIIISHDLEFVRMMEKYTTSYYEVARNEQKLSKITRKEIRQIYEQL